MSVVLENGTEELLYRSKKNDGYWEKTIGNPAEGFNYVTFMVNGTPVVNPAAPVGFGYNRAVNFAEVPERNFSWHELKKTEHGQIHIHYSCDGDGQVSIMFIHQPVMERIIVIPAEYVCLSVLRTKEIFAGYIRER